MTRSVLYVSSVPGTGGAEFSLIELATQLDRDYFTPILLVSEDGALAERFRALGAEVLYASFPFFSRRRPWLYASAIAQITWILAKKRIALVHVNCDRSVPHAVAASRLSGVPVLCHIHDMTRAWFLPPYVRYLNRSDCIIANSGATAQRCFSAGIRSDLTRIVYECFEMDRFLYASPEQRALMRKRWSITPEEVAVGLVGQVLPHKGHSEFLKAADKVTKEFPGTRFLVIGDDALASNKSFMPSLRQLTADLGLSSKVIFTGFIEDIPSAMAALDIVAVPSWAEPFGRVAVEALAAGKPVVATNAGGIPEIVRDGYTGLLCPPRDPEALASVLIQLCRDPNMRREMGQRGPTEAAKFDVSTHVAQVQAIYDEILLNYQRRLGLARILGLAAKWN